VTVHELSRIEARPIAVRAQHPLHDRTLLELRAMVRPIEDLALHRAEVAERPGRGTSRDTLRGHITTKCVQLISVHFEGTVSGFRIQNHMRRGEAMRLARGTTVFVAVACMGLMTLSAGAVSAGASPAKVGKAHFIRSLPDRHIRGVRNAPKGSIPITYSGNWSGYIASPKTDKAVGFNQVSATFNVPSVNCNASPDSFSYHWVGLDGSSDGTVEQDGIAADCPGGTTPQYFAWYEMFPAGLTFEFYVNPGDAIYSQVYYAGGGEYYLYLDDQTSGNYFDVEKACASTCNNSSAEVITEGYYANSSYAGTSDFAEQHYETISVSDIPPKGKSTTGGLTNSQWNTTESIALGQSGNVDTEPSPLASVVKPPQSAFAIYWYRQN